MSNLKVNATLNQTRLSKAGGGPTLLAYTGQQATEDGKTEVVMTHHPAGIPSVALHTLNSAIALLY
jgi:hypothetical protein